MTAKQKAKQEAIERLQKLLKPGDRVGTVLLHVSRSGMMRHIKPVIITSDGEAMNISFYVNAIFEQKQEHEFVKMSGCGMDMGFALVHSLSYYLFPNGYECPGKGCPSADHVNTPRKPYRKGVHHKDGYALKQYWL